MKTEKIEFVNVRMFMYKGFRVEIQEQENASSAIAYKRDIDSLWQPICGAFVHLDKISIQEKIKAKIDNL